MSDFVREEGICTTSLGTDRESWGERAASVSNLVNYLQKVCEVCVSKAPGRVRPDRYMHEGARELWFEDAAGMLSVKCGGQKGVASSSPGDVLASRESH